MADYKDFHENQIKHMEMIQAVVTRLAGNSFLIKGWAMTLTGVLLGFAVDRNDSDLALAALLPTVVFWGLDAYYLRTERLFRELFEEVAKGSGSTIKPFFMAATDRKLFPPPASAAWRKTFARGTLLWFYLALAVATVIVIAAICTGSVSAEESLAAAGLAHAVGHAFEIYLT